MADLPDDIRASVAGNVAQWTRNNREHTDSRAVEQWNSEAISWGMFGVPEDSIGSPLGQVEGLDIVELGCGTAYFSAWLAKRGARPVGVDPTSAQLGTARRAQQETGIEFPLIEGIGEQVPLPDRAFDMVLSEYGASLWADPEWWIPEAARLLRRHGFEVEDLIELQAPPTGKTHEYYDFVSAEWGRQWPAEEIWVARLQG